MAAASEAEEEAWRCDDAEGWLAANGFFPGAAEALRRCDAEGRCQLLLLSRRPPRQARQLLEHAEVPGLRLLEPEEWEGSTKVTPTLTPTPTLTLTLTTDPDSKPNPIEGRRAGGAPSCAARGRALCRNQVGSAFGQPDLRSLPSAPEHASGRPERRPASINQPLGPHSCWLATSGLLSR